MVGKMSGRVSSRIKTSLNQRNNSLHSFEAKTPTYMNPTTAPLPFCRKERRTGE